jgi:hypothetical protein
MATLAGIDQAVEHFNRIRDAAMRGARLAGEQDIAGAYRALTAVSEHAEHANEGLALAGAHLDEREREARDRLEAVGVSSTGKPVDGPPRSGEEVEAERQAVARLEAATARVVDAERRRAARTNNPRPVVDAPQA